MLQHAEWVSVLHRWWESDEISLECDVARALEDLLYQAAPRYVKALKRQGLEKSGGLKGAEGYQAQIRFADWELLQQGIVLEPLLQSISDFLGDHEEMIIVI